MKKNITIILALLLGISILFSFGFYSAYRKSKQAREIAEDNFRSTRVKDSTGFAITLQLTTDQFESELHGYVDSINKLNDEKIKLSRVLRFTQFELKKARENVRVQTRDSFIFGDTIRLGRKAWLRDSCMSVEVFAPDTGAYVYFTTKMNITGSVIVYRGKRRNQHEIFGLKLFRTGKRLTSAKLNTNCDGVQINLNDIEIVR